MKKYNIGIVGLGKMGSMYIDELLKNPRWNIKSACDINKENLEKVKKIIPGVEIFQSPENIFNDPLIDVVGIFTYADGRYDLIKKALNAGKHILAEKPLAVDTMKEKELLDIIEKSKKIVAVNLFNRNAWYHKEMQAFIASGEIGELAIIRVSHQTQGKMPSESNVTEIEGAPFHCCGMHYVDVARWYAKSEYDRWNAQGVRLWNWHEPWWVEVHGSFKNGIVFSIVNGFVYAQMSDSKTSNCGIELIGTLGVVRMNHDFKEVNIEYFGVNKTLKKSGPYGNKKIDVMLDVFADSLDKGENMGFPTARDSVIASSISREMLESTLINNAAPVIGTKDDIKKIFAHKKIKGLYDL